MKREHLGLVFAGALVLAGCLPGDIRPEPGRVYVTAEASAMSTDGFSTDDGWSIQFDRLLVGLGNVSLGGDACNEYAGSGYDRLFDFAKAGAQKLGEVYGLGGCRIQFRLRSPSTDSLLENGVSAADREFMRKLPELGPLPMDGPLPRTAVYVRGVATRSNETKRFDWKFVARSTLSNCLSHAPDAQETSFVQLKAGDDQRSKVTFHGEDLFHEGMKDGAALKFGLFAGADANGDGDVTLEELAKLDAPMIEMDGGVADADAGVTDVSGLAGFAGFMTTELLPRMFYFDGNRCAALPQRSRGGGPF